MLNCYLLQANCMIKGGKLAEIESPEENNYIMSLVMKLTGKFALHFLQ